MLIIPFMSCSARYPVYILIISAFFEKFQGTLLFLIYLTGILLAALFALLLKKTLFNRKEMPFVMELPPYRMPTLRAILKHTWFKGSLYLKKMGGIILVASLIIWALGYFPRNPEIIHKYDTRKALAEASLKAEFEALDFQDMESRVIAEYAIEDSLARIEHKKNNELQKESFIGKLGHIVEPVIQPLGFDWKIGISLVAGLTAKEVVVSTMGVLYQTDPDSESVSSLSQKLKQEKYESGEEAGKPVYRPLVALSLIIFVLIYFPCVAVIAAVKRESGGWKNALFLAVYTTAAAWLLSFLVYNVGSMLGY
jgi:ferrous iron transport protein B